MIPRQTSTAIRGICLLLMAAALALPCSGATAEAPWSMFDLYEENRKASIPNYITEDFLLLAHAMVARRTVTDLETRILIPSFTELTRRVHQRLRAAEGTDAAAGVALDFLSVIRCLLSGADRPGTGEAARPEGVAAELDRVREGVAILPSDLMGQTIDYTQFIPRGRYARDDRLGRYFMAMRYAGTILFPVTASRATGIRPETADLLTRAALRLVAAIHADPELVARRNRLATRLTWLFGPPDDLTHADYHTVANSAGDRSVSDIRGRLLERARTSGRQPLVLSGLISKAALEEGISPRDALTGWRFIPQRYTPDAAAFQQLVYDRVTLYQGRKDPFSLVLIEGKPVKGFPLGLELMALLGSERASRRLDAADERNYRGYPSARIRAEAILAGSMDIPTLISAHLSVLRDWVTGETAGPDGPDGDRRLNSALSFWTWNRYIALLYTKQSYTLAGKGLDIPLNPRKSAWIEPAPGLYGDLAAAVAALKQGLTGGPEEAGGMAPILDRLTTFESILRRCRRIAAAAADGAAPTGDEAAFLNDLDKRLLDLTGETDAPIVTDVHTEPASSRVLQEAIGLPRVVTTDAGGETTRGALFRYYEFSHPMDRRMTDEAWRQTVTDPEAMADVAFSPSSSRPGR